jgi:hypothetical protein
MIATLPPLEPSVALPPCTTEHDLFCKHIDYPKHSHAGTLLCRARPGPLRRPCAGPCGPRRVLVVSWSCLTRAASACGGRSRPGLSLCFDFWLGGRRYRIYRPPLRPSLREGDA